MSNADEGGRPRPPTFGGAGKPSKNEDNPFLRQLELMLEKSTSNRSAASPSLPRSATAAASAAAAASTSTRPPAAPPRGPGVVSSAGVANGRGAVGSWVSQVGQRPLSAQPKTAAAADSSCGMKAGPTRTGPRSIFSMLDSSDEDNDDDHRRFGVGAGGKRSTPATAAGAAVVAEAKRCSDGGWPETKRCLPPNLKALSSESADSKHGGGGGGSSGHGGEDERRGLLPSSLRGGNAAENGSRGGKSSGITGDRSYGAAGITGPLVSSKGHTDGRTLSPRGARWRAPGSDDEWMSDAEDARGSRGLKRGRASHRRSSLEGGGSGQRGDSGSNSDNSDGRGRKTGRWSDRYPAPIPARKERCNSLSLSPSRLPDDYVTSEEEENDGKNPIRAKGAGARAGGRKGTSGNHRGGGASGDSGSGKSGARESKKVLSLASPASSRRGPAGSAAGDGGSRGRKRAHEDLLNDRIEALRVSSDGEETPRSGGKDGRGRGQAHSTGEEEEEEEEVDYEDLRPHFEDPPWLGDFEPFLLEGGERINPSINRYLRGYQREGVRGNLLGIA